MWAKKDKNILDYGLTSQNTAHEIVSALWSNPR
jgi:hypothetical protein